MAPLTMHGRCRWCAGRWVRRGAAGSGCGGPDSGGPPVFGPLPYQYMLLCLLLLQNVLNPIALCRRTVLLPEPPGLLTQRCWLCRALLQAFGRGNFPGVESEALAALEGRYASRIEEGMEERLAGALEAKRLVRASARAGSGAGEEGQGP